MKSDMSKLRLKWKIYAFLLGFCALLLMILWLFQTVFLDSFYRTIKVMELKSDASSIEENINSTNLSDWITGIAQSSDLSIEVLSNDGSVLHSFTATKDMTLRNMPPPDKLTLIAQALNNDNVFYEYLSNPRPFNEKKGDFIGRMPPVDKQPNQILIYVKIIPLTSGDSVALLMSSMISPVDATVTTLRYQLILITGIMLILSILLALIIARRVSKPIEDINQSAKRLAQGDYKTQFSGTGFQEIVELSDTLNATAIELSKVESLRRELMANISHDLRTPLSLIYSHAEMMHDFPDEVTPEQTQVIMDETQRLSSLVNDVLDISKLESGIQKLNPSVYNLTQSLNATITRLKQLIKNEGYELSFIYDHEVNVVADEIKVTQAFYNLLINAVNYTGKDKKVIIQQSVNHGSVKIEVRDSGEGIAAENLPYIWERYYKVDKQHKRAITGTGLGLSIVKKVIELHDGEYGVISQLGEGSTFWFRLKSLKP
jgi:signal transduction histidine kinase